MTLGPLRPIPVGLLGDLGKFSAGKARGEECLTHRDNQLQA
jgi:hypothetical protein